MIHHITKRLSSLGSLVRPLLLMFVGILLLSLGITSLFLWVYHSASFPPVFFYLTLQFLPGPTRGLLLLLLGMTVLAASLWHLSGVVIIRLREGEISDEVLLGYRHSRQQPRVAILSGGAGMLMLANLGEHVERLTCITPIQDSVEYYYRASSLFQVENMYYVVPTPAQAKVYAELDDGTRLNVMRINPPNNPDPSLAQRHVERLFLVPENETEETTYSLTRLAREALQEADAIILGPGSLFESIIPNFLIEELRTIIQQSTARKIYICNLMTEPGLTAGFDVAEHIRQIRQYGGFDLDYVLVNIQRIDPEVRQLYAESYQAPVYLDPEEYEETTILSGEGISRRHVVVENTVVIESDLASSVIQYSTSLDNPSQRRTVRVLRHDPQKLSSAVLQLLRRE